MSERRQWLNGVAWGEPTILAEPVPEHTPAPISGDLSGQGAERSATERPTTSRHAPASPASVGHQNAHETPAAEGTRGEFDRLCERWASEGGSRRERVYDRLDDGGQHGPVELAREVLEAAKTHGREVRDARNGAAGKR